MTSRYNIPLMRKTMEYIESHPNEWHQANWFFDYEDALQNYENALQNGDLNSWERQDCTYLAQYFANEIETRGCSTVMCFAGTAMTLAGEDVRVLKVDEIQRLAMEILGLNKYEAMRIFLFMTNNPTELRRCVEEVIGEKL